VTAEHQRRTRRASFEHADHIRPAVACVFDGDVKADASHHRGNGIGDLALAWRSRHECRVDRVDRDELAKQADSRV